MSLLIKIVYVCCVITWRLSLCVLSVLEKTSPICTAFLNIIVKTGSSMFVK